LTIAGPLEAMSVKVVENREEPSRVMGQAACEVMLRSGSICRSGRELSSNVVDGGASGGVLNLGFAIDEPDAANDLGEPGWAVHAPPAPLGALAEPEDHGQRRPS
jgi:hypothetical protein